MEEEIDWTTMAICPFDATHVVARLRLSTHVNKCKKHHPEKHVRMCPFNATHYIENHEFQHHLLHCSDRAVIDRDIMQSSEMEDGLSYSGNVALPAYDNICESEENWDEEANFPGFSWNSILSYPASTQVRQPRQEPAVLDAMDQAEISRRLEERRQSRQVNTSNSFLGRPGDNRTGSNGAGASIYLGNGATYDGAGRVRNSNGASGTNSDSDGNGTTSASGASGAGGTNENNVCRESQRDGRFAAPVLAGLGRGISAQEPVPASISPVSATVGRGRAAQSLQQPRRVTQTAAFTLPGVGRGFSAFGRGGGAPGGVARPGQGGR